MPRSGQPPALGATLDGWTSVSLRRAVCANRARRRQEWRVVLEGALGPVQLGQRTPGVAITMFEPRKMKPHLLAKYPDAMEELQSWRESRSINSRVGQPPRGLNEMLHLIEWFKEPLPSSWRTILAAEDERTERALPSRAQVRKGMTEMAKAKPPVARTTKSQGRQEAENQLVTRKAHADFPPPVAGGAAANQSGPEGGSAEDRGAGSGMQEGQRTSKRFRVEPNADPKAPSGGPLGLAGDAETETGIGRGGQPRSAGKQLKPKGAAQRNPPPRKAYGSVPRAARAKAANGPSLQKKGQPAKVSHGHKHMKSSLSPLLQTGDGDASKSSKAKRGWKRKAAAEEPRGSQQTRANTGDVSCGRNRAASETAGGNLVSLSPEDHIGTEDPTSHVSRPGDTVSRIKATTTNPRVHEEVAKLLAEAKHFVHNSTAGAKAYVATLTKGCDHSVQKFVNQRVAEFSLKLDAVNRPVAGQTGTEAAVVQNGGNAAPETQGVEQQQQHKQQQQQQQPTQASQEARPASPAETPGGNREPPSVPGQGEDTREKKMKLLFALRVLHQNMVQQLEALRRIGIHPGRPEGDPNHQSAHQSG